MLVGMLRLTIIGLALLLTACGYTLQNSQNPLRDKEGVTRIYVAPIVNSTYKPGIENVVYNSLLRSLSSRHALELVRDPELADATLYGTVVIASQSISASNTTNNIQPYNMTPDRRNNNPNGTVNATNSSVVATQYTADLQCSFNLQRRKLKFAKQPKQIWGASFDRSEPFAGSNQLDIYGTTSALINDSELDRALTDLASTMMIDVEEAMLSVF